MYSRKSVGWRMEPSGTPTLTGYSFEDFLSRITWSQLLPRKDKLRPNTWPEISYVKSLWRRPVCQILSKVVKRSPVEREYLILYQKLQRRLHFLRWLASLTFTEFFKDLSNHRKKTKAAVVFSCRLPNILKCRVQKWDQLTIWKTIILQTHIKKLRFYFFFFRALAGIQSGLGTFDESELVMTLGVNQLRGFINIMQFQISSRREIR